MKLWMIAAATFLAASGTGVAAASTAQPPRASLEGFSCRHASQAIDRAISVIAVMRPEPGTEAMALKFDLLRRLARDDGFAVVKGGDLGEWRRPQNPTLGQRPGDVWKLKKVVADLAAPALYRFKVYFRWTGSDLHARTVLFTRLCDERT